MNADASAEELPGCWWAPRHLDEGQCAEWVIGPLTVTVRRLCGEWRIGYERSANTDSVGGGQQDSVATPEERAQLERFVSSRTDGHVRLLPALADRPVVARPASPLVLPPGESVVVFVSTPLWVRLVLGESESTALEIPAVRPSDTWLGRSTREGQLCYASRTQARLELEAVPRRPHRALTPLCIANEARSDLKLERVGLPVPYLSLFCEPGGGLWTERVTLRREHEGADTDLEIEPGGPSPDLEPVTGPRSTHREGLLNRAFSALLG